MKTRKLLHALVAAVCCIEVACAVMGTVAEARDSSCRTLIKAHDYQTATKACSEAADEGSASSAYQLGLIYLNGYGVSEDSDKAFNLIHTAAVHGYQEAMLKTAQMIIYSIGTQFSRKDASYWLLKDIKAGGTASKALLHKLNNAGIQVLEPPMNKIHAECHKLLDDEGFPAAVKACEESAEAGSLFAQYALAKYYFYGTDEPDGHSDPDFKKAFQWASVLTGENVAYGEYLLGFMYRYGVGIPPNEDQAIQLFTDAANQGCTEAAYETGLMYLRGISVEKNMAKAEQMLNIAVETGTSAEALYELAGIEAVSGRMESALEHYRTAADLGLVRAEVETGRILMDSEPGSAEHYLSKAFSHGSAEAGELLSQIHNK